MKKSTPWNKGLTKETDERIKKYSDKKLGKKGSCWTEEQEEILKKRYPTANLNELSKKLGRSIKSVRDKAEKLKINRKIKINLNSKNGMWKGNKVGYNALHDWIRKRKLKPELCENCGKNKPYDLSNISDEYKRDINDFKWLCRRCHMLQDNRILNLKQYRSK